jgi:hypothetical protein
LVASLPFPETTLRESLSVPAPIAMPPPLGALFFVT